MFALVETLLPRAVRALAVDPVALWLAELALGAALLVGLAALACRFARAASVRHVIWTATFVALLALPALGALVPNLGTLPLELTPPERAAAEVPPALPKTKMAPPAVASPATGTTPPTPTAPLPGIEPAAPGRAEPDTAAPVASLRREVPPGLLPSGTALLAGIWALGTALLLLRLALLLARRRRLLVAAQRFERDDLEQWTAELAAPGRPPRLLVCDALEIPVTWGFFRPRVLFPLGATEWNPRRLRHALLHELAHARRADTAWITVARVARALYWPLPFVWWAEARLVTESEHACDDQVVRAGAAPSSYARDLLGVARELSGSLPEPVAAMARRSDLGSRVRAVLDPGRDRSAPSGPAVAAILVLACGVVAPLVASVRIADPASQSVEELAHAEAIGARRHTARSAAATSGRAVTGLAPQSRTAMVVDQHDGEGEPELLPGCGPLRATQVERRRDRLTLELRTADCVVELEVDGEVEIAEDERSVARIARGARMVLSEEVGGVSRRLVVEAGAGGLPDSTLTVDGRARELGAEERAWLAQRLPLVLRATGWDAEARVGRILARSGVDGLFEEIARIPNDHVSRLYLVHTLERAELSTPELRRWIDLAGATVGSDFELAETLSALPTEALASSEIQQAFVGAAGTIGSDFELRRTLSRLLAQGRPDGEMLDAVLESARTIGSDFELAELLADLLRRYPADRPIPNAFFEVTATIGSDFELRRTLGAFLGRDDLARSADQLDAVLEAAAGIGSDFEAAELLVAVARRYPPRRPLPDAYFAVAETIGSDFELRRTLGEAARRELSPSGVERLLQAAVDIGSDFELAELLLEVRRRHPLEGGAREAFDRAVATLSGYERRRVEGTS
ncbi:MAG TPA: M56 family metallopeptidase [Thermoanaerobaculia bacterium]|nr:M56 family metallopeptidase [Thermoanaerobaculia bacterium]